MAGIQLTPCMVDGTANYTSTMSVATGNSPGGKGTATSRMSCGFGPKLELAYLLSLRIYREMEPETSERDACASFAAWTTRLPRPCRRRRRAMLEFYEGVC